MSARKFAFLLCCVVPVWMLSGSLAAQINKELVDAADPEPPVMMPHLDPDNPDVIRLKKDPNRDMWRTEVDSSEFPDREAGPMNLQRYEAQLETVGIKTFFQKPLALTPEDLVEGQVDVAIFGAPTGALPHSGGSVWAPAEIRYTRDWGTYGATLPLGWVDGDTLIDPFTIINVVDYGDAGMDPYNQARTLEEIRRITREVAETGAIPFAVGGDHSVPNATYRAMVDVYGKKQVAFVHFDAHLDRGFGKFGAFYHSGSYMTMAVAEGLLDGKAVFQFGMSAPAWGEKDWKQVKDEGATVYSLHEIRRDGVKETFDDLLERLEPYDKVYISFDIDVFDMSYAPGVGSAIATGLTPNDLFPQIRRLAASTTIVGFDLVEYQPFYDNRGQQTARLCRRVLHQFLTGIAMKQKGLPGDWVNPLVSGDP